MSRNQFGYPVSMTTMTGTSLWLDRSREGSQDQLPADGRCDDIVVGAGITGLTTALLLARSGRRVVVLEAGQVGGLTTGKTTGKISLLQGTKLTRLLRTQSQQVAQRYVDANREGMEWLLRFCETHGVAYQPRDAVTFAAQPGEIGAVRDEHDAALAVGLPVTWHDELGMAFPVHGATRLPEQAQVDPVELVDALVDQIRQHGGTVHAGERVVSVSAEKVTLAGGSELAARDVVLATGSPIVDRGLHFARIAPKRSYLLAFEGFSEELPMCISVGASTRSVRDAPLDGGRLLVGGAGHTVGRAQSEARHIAELREWAAKTFPAVVETHTWSAQDYSPYDEVPIVGTVPLSQGHVYVATGFDKWGMTNAPAAALDLTSRILGGKAIRMRSNPITPSALKNVTVLNLEVAAHLLRGGIRPEHRCTHLGAALNWNDAECTWDCPLHGSRFTEDGEVIEGPATKPLVM